MIKILSFIFGFFFLFNLSFSIFNESEIQFATGFEENTNFVDLSPNKLSIDSDGAVFDNEEKEINFDGIDDFIEIEKSFYNSDNFSISFFVNKRAAGGGSITTQFSKELEYVSIGYDGNNFFWLNIRNEGSYYPLTSDESYEINKYHHILITKKIIVIIIYILMENI